MQVHKRRLRCTRRIYRQRRAMALLNKLAREQGCTLFMLLLAAFDVVVGRYAGQEDIVVGTPIAGRGRTELEGLIGILHQHAGAAHGLKRQSALQQNCWHGSSRPRSVHTRTRTCRSRNSWYELLNPEPDIGATVQSSRLMFNGP